jgi:hypothetical protein
MLYARRWKSSWPCFKNREAKLDATIQVLYEGLRKTTEYLSQARLSPGRYFDPGPPEYEAGMLIRRLHISVFIFLRVKEPG